MATSPCELIFMEGTVSTVIYRNEENGYTILLLDTSEGEEVTVVGAMPGVTPGGGVGGPRPVDPPQHLRPPAPGGDRGAAASGGRACGV